jgi:hypothetical protein
MNNKPVAWLTDRNTFYFDIEDARRDCDGFIDPLYTHPKEHDLGIAEAIGFDKGYAAAQKKTLTDEEILKMASDMFHYSEYKLVIEFARAILRKAQEK